MADTPPTTCRNRGRKLMEPNMATPMTKLTPLLTLKMDPRNRRRGRSGSSARRSASTKAPTRASAAALRPMIVGEVHGYWVPPQVVTRTMQLTAPASSPAPT